MTNATDQVWAVKPATGGASEGITVVKGLGNKEREWLEARQNVMTQRGQQARGAASDDGGNDHGGFGVTMDDILGSDGVIPPDTDIAAVAAIINHGSGRGVKAKVEDESPREALIDYLRQTWADHGAPEEKMGKVETLLGDPDYEGPFGLTPWVPIRSIAQQFIRRPYLWDGSKFHIRLYLVVTSYPPRLRAYIGNIGFAFKSLNAYDHDLRVPEDAIFSRVGADVNSLPLSDFWQHLKSEGKDPGSVWASTKEVVRQLFASYKSSPHRPTDMAPPHTQDGSCFDMFGLDIMYDETLQPFVLEVNDGPNLVIDPLYPEQEKLKGAVVSGVVGLMAAKIRLSKLMQAEKNGGDGPDLQTHLLNKFGWLNRTNLEGSGGYSSESPSNTTDDPSELSVQFQSMVEDAFLSESFDFFSDTRQ
jgi:hypothetical protein